MKKVTLSLLLSTSTMFAHQITAQKLRTTHIKLNFWAHGEFQEFESRQLKGALAFDINNKRLLKQELITQKVLHCFLTAKKPAMISLTFDAGYWVEGENGYENV
ncbi:MAG: hypothetical protein ACNI3H_04270 [Halarcobacter ebronensis]